MSGTASLHAGRMKFRWARLDPDLDPGIHEPKHEGDCGWDLVAMQDMTIAPQNAVDIPINCRLELPPGYWAEMKARSSIAKRGLQIDAGTIDNGYRGPLYVVCRNTKTDKPITVKAGERIAQLVFHRLHEVWAEEVEEININGSTRGESGFGSTGR